MIDEATWMLPNNVFHAQHWYELEARAEIAIYDRSVERELDALEPLFEGLGRSVLLRVTTVQSLLLWLRGRIAMRLGQAKQVERTATRLARVDKPRARVLTAMLEAGLAGRTRDTAAVTKLRDAVTYAAELGMRLHGAAARYQLGKLVGGSEGHEHVVAAERTMAAERIANPERFADWFVPGLQK